MIRQLKEGVKIYATELFGCEFTHIPHSFVSNLRSLQSEGAIYTDRRISQLDDFRHVRIQLTDDEKAEYVRSMWAFEHFLRAGCPERAANVPGIPHDIAERADTYVYDLFKDIVPPKGPPHHCLAGFLGRDLEQLLCFASGPRVVILEEVGREAFLSTCRRAVDALTPSIRRFCNREKGLTPWTISCEDDVRDLLFVMLRAAIADIRTEEPIPSRGGTYKVVDIYSELAKVLIEVKWLSATSRWRRVLAEINDDIQSYIAHKHCRTLLFVIVDAGRICPDPARFEVELTGAQVIGEKTVDVHVLIRAP
jgi:REase_DpnII-MboI